jgi:hypothetical protein
VSNDTVGVRLYRRTRETAEKEIAALKAKVAAMRLALEEISFAGHVTWARKRAIKALEEVP